MSAIELRALRKAFGGLDAVAGVDLAVRSGEFVAAFLGRTNLIPGRVDGAGTFRGERGALVRTAPSPLELRGQSAVVSVRPHHLRPQAGADPAAGGSNRFEGKVLRATYFGEGVDYLVDVPALGQGLRVAGPAAPRVAVGEAMALLADPAHCLVLPQE